MSELIESINHLSVSLHEQDRIKKQITSDVAHELRTPLSTLQISVEAIMDGIIKMDDNRLKSIHDEILRLTKIVKDLEQLTKIEQVSKLELSTFNLNELINECLVSLDIKRNEKTIDVQMLGDLLNIEADRNRLYQVFYNLIVNSYNYSNPNSTLTIETIDKGKEVVIIVKDTGIGIPEESLPFIFERFYRVDSSRSRESGGSGIGLTLVKQFIEAHDGSIEVESEINVGTTFSIILPIKQSS